MELIPQIETPSGGDYPAFKKAILDFAESLRTRLEKPLQGVEVNYVDRLIIEQNDGMNGLVLLKDLKEMVKNIELSFAFNLRDKNRIAIFSDLIALRQIGIKNIIVSEGAHPLKTRFKGAKPVYDIDVLSLTAMIKKGEINHNDFRVGAVTGASTLADGVRIKKLDKTGADEFLVNYSTDMDKSVIDLIKETGKPFFIVSEEGENDFLKGLFKKASGFGASGVIIKIKSRDLYEQEKLIDKWEKGR